MRPRPEPASRRRKRRFGKWFGSLALWVVFPAAQAFCLRVRLPVPASEALRQERCDQVETRTHRKRQLHCFFCLHGLHNPVTQSLPTGRAFLRRECKLGGLPIESSSQGTRHATVAPMQIGFKDIPSCGFHSAKKGSCSPLDSKVHPVPGCQRHLALEALSFRDSVICSWWLLQSWHLQCRDSAPF